MMKFVDEFVVFFNVEENGRNFFFIVDVVAELVGELNQLVSCGVLGAEDNLVEPNYMADGRSQLVWEDFFVYF